jgi:hypothetical protein
MQQVHNVTRCPQLRYLQLHCNAQTSCPCDGHRARPSARAAHCLRPCPRCLLYCCALHRLCRRCSVQRQNVSSTTPGACFAPSCPLSYPHCSFRLYSDSNGNVDPNSEIHEKLFKDFDKARRSYSITETVALLTIVFLYAALLFLCRRRLHSVEVELLSLRAVSSSPDTVRHRALRAAEAADHDKNSASISPEISSKVSMKIKKIKSRVFTVCVICMLSMSFRAAYNTCATITPLLPLVTF